MTFFLGPILAALLATSITTEPAPGMAVGSIVTHHGQVNQTAKVGDAAQGYVTIENQGNAADVLTGWSCAIADTTGLVGADGKAIQTLPIPAGQSVLLAANGPHLTLQGTHFTIMQGSVLPCTLTFQNAGDIQILLFAQEPPKS